MAVPLRRTWGGQSWKWVLRPWCPLNPQLACLRLDSWVSLVESKNAQVHAHAHTHMHSSHTCRRHTDALPNTPLSSEMVPRICTDPSVAPTSLLPPPTKEP